MTPAFPIFQQLTTEASPVVPVNIFNVAEADANWMKQQPGYISTQLHRGIAGSAGAAR